MENYNESTLGNDNDDIGGKVNVCYMGDGDDDFLVFKLVLGT